MEDEEENLNLVGKGKVKAKKNPNDGATSQDKKKGVRKVKCFTYHKLGHYAS